MNGIKFLKFIFPALFLPTFCFAEETTTTSTLPEFLQNQFLPTLGQILTDLVPLFIMIIGISIAFIFLKGFIEFFKPFFKGK
jgi:hypothetical protein